MNADWTSKPKKILFAHHSFPLHRHFPLAPLPLVASLPNFYSFQLYNTDRIWNRSLCRKKKNPRSSRLQCLTAVTMSDITHPTIKGTIT
jgi:hypothetical protein